MSKLSIALGRYEARARARALLPASAAPPAPARPPRRARSPSRPAAPARRARRARARPPRPPRRARPRPRPRPRPPRRARAPARARARAPARARARAPAAAPRRRPPRPPPRRRARARARRARPRRPAASAAPARPRPRPARPPLPAPAPSLSLKENFARLFGEARPYGQGLWRAQYRAIALPGHRVGSFQRRGGRQARARYPHVRHGNWHGHHRQQGAGNPGRCVSRRLFRRESAQEQRLPGHGLGARVVGEEDAKSLVDTWLKSDFEGGKSAAKVERMKAIEQQFTASKK